MTTNDPQLAQHFDGCLATSARVISRAITAAFDEALRPLDIKPTQVTLLATLATLGEATQTEIAPALRIDQTTLSRTLRTLAGRGLITQADAEDQRRTPYRLTPAGRRLLKRAAPLWSQAQSRAEAALGLTGAEALRRSATKLSHTPG